MKNNIETNLKKYTANSESNNISRNNKINENIINTVEKYRKLILESEKFIWQHPETGYKEYETSAYMKKVFLDLGYEIIEAEGITGFYTILDTGRPGPEVLVLSELDSVICPNHPEANPETGAVHACGHNAQCAALIGVAAALKDSEVRKELWGKVRLCAVPAEELLELEYRNELKKQGKIKYFSGKTEFLSRGYFDGVDMAFMVHAAPVYMVVKGAVGCITKQITYKGKAAHAGGAPWEGVNALYAANCGINAVNALRETFKEEDIIRFHPIITKGGEMVNGIPDEAVMESYVRGVGFDAICKANKKINRALCGGAVSLGANVRIKDGLGYAPLINDDKMIMVAEIAANEILRGYSFTVCEDIGSGSTDMGDLSCIMPVVHPYAGGATGKSHGSDYKIEDPVAACVDNAKFQLRLLNLLLSEKAVMAKKIINEYNPTFKSKEEYLSFANSLSYDEETVEYKKDKVIIKFPVKKR